MSRPRWIRLAAAAVAVVLAGCSSSSETNDDGDGPTADPSSADSPASDPPKVAVVDRASPWPNRPVVDLRFDAASGLETIRGTERVRFVAEERVCQLMFRLWANKPALVTAGTELTVDRVRVVRGARHRPVARPPARATTRHGDIQGGDMLREAMESVDDVADALLLGYINANAHAIATPSDVADAFAPAPSIVGILHDYGAVA